MSEYPGDTKGATAALVSAVSSSSASPLDAARLALSRDLRLAFRKRGQLVQPLVFFAIVTTLFPWLSRRSCRG